MTTQPLSWDMVANFQTLFTFPFMQNAYISATIIAIVCGVIGWFTILRSQTYIAHTLSTIVFPGATVATLLGVAPLLGYVGFALIGAVFLAVLQHHFDKRGGIIATIQVTFFALGYFFASLQTGFVSSASSALFGNLLTITRMQSFQTAIIGASVLLLLSIFGRRLLFISVDERVAKANGISSLVSLMYLLLLAIVVAITSQITGTLLVLTLLVFPAATVQQFCTSPQRSIAATVALGLTIVWLGLAIGYFFDMPIGFVLTVIGGTLYLATKFVFRARSRAW